MLSSTLSVLCNILSLLFGYKSMQSPARNQPLFPWTKQQLACLLDCENLAAYIVDIHVDIVDISEDIALHFHHLLQFVLSSIVMDSLIMAHLHTVKWSTTACLLYAVYIFREDMAVLTLNHNLVHHFPEFSTHSPHPSTADTPPCAVIGNFCR